MKTLRYMLAFAAVTGVSFLYSCGEQFLERAPLGSLSEEVVANPEGLENLLIGAYAALDGQNMGATEPWAVAADNWIYGSIVGGDAHKGTDAGDQPAINPIEGYAADASNTFFNQNWRVRYESIARCNNVLKFVELVEDLSEEDKQRITAEARFLRGHFYFELKRMFNMVPWIDETTEDFKKVNDQDIWPMIEADFQYAMSNLPETQDQAGRANSWASTAYLAKTYLYQNKFAEAKALLDDVIANGVTARGQKYALLANFSQNFNPAFENSSESVFAVQMSANDGSGGIDNARQGAMLNFPYNKWCCGFYQPSLDLANSYRTTPEGLPFLDSYNEHPLKTDQNLSSEAAFTPDEGPLDPRLDWTVGRRGIPYLGHGLHPGNDWVRDQAYAGPYSGKKHVYRAEQEGTAYDGGSWAPGTSINYDVIRFADVLLWAAECEVEVGSLEKAREYVNMIRQRAANPGDFVEFDNGVPAANYQISSYTAPWTDQEAARAAVRFERKLELAMEGHRFFDLVRWGVADQVLNNYIDFESQFRTYMRGAQFTKGQDEYFPIPQRQIDLSTTDGNATLIQNPGYN